MFIRFFTKKCRMSNVGNDIHQSHDEKRELCDQLFISETQLNRLHNKMNILMKNTK